MDKKIAFLIKKDLKLKVIFNNASPLDFKASFATVYPALLSSIVSQQLSLKAAATIYGRFLDLFEGNSPLPHQLIQTEHKLLRSVGLSNRKAEYVKNVAQHFIDYGNNIPDWSKMSNEEIINELVVIKGVGVWTVQMILIFTLLKEDVFPVLDLAIQKAMKLVYGLDNSNKKEFLKDLEAIAENWKPDRTLVSRYLWLYMGNDNG